MRFDRQAGQKPDKGPCAEARHGSVVVPIYKTHVRNGVSYVAAWREGGKRMRKGFVSLEAAEAHGRVIAKGLALHGANAVTLTGSDLLEYRRALEIVRPLGIPLDVAAQEAAETRRNGAAKLEECPDVPVIVEEFLKAKAEAGRSKEHVRDIRARLRTFAKAFPGPLSGVRPGDVEDWTRAMYVSHRTRRNYLGAVTNLVRFAGRKGYIAKGSLDLSGIERGESHADVAIFTPQELRQLLDACRPDMVPFVALGAFAGLRTAEIRRLTWEEVGAEYIDVRARKAKTRQRRLVPILPTLAKWLEARRGKGDICPLAEPWDELRRTSARSGVAWKLNGMRHSFGTYRLAIVKSETQVALEMGNSPSMVFAHYRAVVTEQQAQEWFGVLPSGTPSTGTAAQ